MEVLCPAIRLKTNAVPKVIPYDLVLMTRLSCSAAFERACNSRESRQGNITESECECVSIILLCTRLCGLIQDTSPAKHRAILIEPVITP